MFLMMATCSNVKTLLSRSAHPVIQFHDGLPCVMYQSVKTGEGKADKRIRESPATIKECPQL